MSELLFEYKVRYRYKTGYKEFSFYATTEIEEFLNRNNIEYVRNMTDTVESRLFKEIERLNKKIEQYENPEDMTLMFMWCDEKAKDEIKRLNNIINEIENDLLDRYYGRGKYHLSTDIIGIPTFYRRIKELKGDSSNE